MKELTEYPITPDEAYKPSFLKGDKVKLKKEAVGISSIHEAIKDKVLIVDKCKVTKWDSVIAESVYLVQDLGVRNPYLAEYFEKVE